MARPYLKNNQYKKGWESGSTGRSSRMCACETGCPEFPQIKKECVNNYRLIDNL
jgi:hypothetical protein